MKLISWNVNGIRATLKKGFDENLATMAPDVLCLQETKAQDDQVKEALAGVEGFYVYSNSAVRKGYSGTAVLSKTEPTNVEYDLGIEEHDQEGRVITVEYDSFFVVNVYVPNSGSELARLDYRKTWDAALLDHLRELETGKPVLFCGDLNVAHQRIDIARPDANYNKSAGFTQTEIDGMDNYVNSGLVDTFRSMHPETVKYSWWSFRANARAKNIGWRIDYFLASQSLMSQVNEAFILNEIHGSDHCPVGIELGA